MLSYFKDKGRLKKHLKEANGRSEARICYKKGSKKAIDSSFV